MKKIFDVFYLTIINRKKLINRLEKLKYLEEGIKEEEKEHKEGATHSRGYNLGIEDAQRLINGEVNDWIDSSENSHNKKENGNTQTKKID